jgi:hypothetical protein
MVYLWFITEKDRNRVEEDMKLTSRSIIGKKKGMLKVQLKKSTDPKEEIQGLIKIRMTK